MAEMLDRINAAMMRGANNAAAVVLRELRVPSPEMLAAAARLKLDKRDDLAIWEAMIDAAFE